MNTEIKLQINISNMLQGSTAEFKKWYHKNVKKMGHQNIWSNFLLFSMMHYFNNRWEGQSIQEWSK